ncbi:MAG: DUF3536 domain-containing protein [Synechococcaceae cyanobacterium RM1_1_27]|nr:DUF3536 domain-containing protein [Synechococcaceae cyanobacterium RM1_1_27]
MKRSRRPEGVQILRYAARAIELAGEVSSLSLEPEFVSRLSLAPSNVAQFRDGAELYRQLVRPALISLTQIAAQFAIPRWWCRAIVKAMSMAMTSNIWIENGEAWARDPWWWVGCCCILLVPRRPMT